MLKILNTDQIKAWDAYTMQHEPIASIDLMERACLAFTKWFTEKFEASSRVAVVCAGGNNGGDGLGIARLLSEYGYSVEVYLIKGTVTESADFKINRNRLPEAVKFHNIEDAATLRLNGYDFVIDGLFGSGLTRPIEGIYADAIHRINESKSIKVAIDIPSGLFVDKPTGGICVQADFTVSFQLPKLAFFMPENQDKVGQWKCVDIGLSKSFLKESKTSNSLVQRKDIIRLFPKRKKFAHKGDLGRALLVAGGYGKMGACVLAASAAMRSGVGLLNVHTPKCGYEIIQISIPEAMVSVDENEFHFSGHHSQDSYTAVGIGPGIGTHKESAIGLRNLLENAKCPILLDADALNILAEHRELLHLIPFGSILTPHPGELKRLIGPWSNDFERLDKTKEFAQSSGCVIVIKGAYSAIVSNDGSCYFNPTGNPGMATGGSGDVLTGVLTALLAQSIPGQEAAIIGVFLHGLAGDLAAFEKGYSALIASDIVNSLSEAFKEINR